MPAHSAAYLQLTTSGDLATLGNEELERALIRYHSRLNRDANYHPTLIELVIEDVATNPFVDRIVSEATISGAAIDNDNSAYRPVERIRSYDLEGLRAYEHRYEAMFLLHGTLRDTDRRQLELATERLSVIEAEQRR
jgi:hypothetical protein